MPRNARKEGFSRRHRFAEQGSFSPVLRGSRKVKGSLAVVHAVAASSQTSRLGIAVTRRLVPRSTDRNSVKRLIREAFRRHPLKKAALDCVVSLRERFDAASLPALRSEIGSLFDCLSNADSR
ncbi:MAG: ribonuclease P protein component [Usitatibacter sp.]